MSIGNETIVKISNIINEVKETKLFSEERNHVLEVLINYHKLNSNYLCWDSLPDYWLWGFNLYIEVGNACTLQPFIGTTNQKGQFLFPVDMSEIFNWIRPEYRDYLLTHLHLFV